MIANDNRHVIAVADPAALAAAAAERLLARITANSGRVAICLTGGSSPKQLYQLLATDAYRSRIPWERTHWFIGDERFVPASDPLNNMGMARSILLDGLAPAANIHPIPTATADPADPDRGAALYEQELKSFYGADALDHAHPLFDLVLMGVGPDGHTASLFQMIPRSRRPRAGPSAFPGPMSSRSSHGSPSRCPPSPPAAKCCSRLQAWRSVRS
jgi:6-phosphogluconolactonase